MPSLGGMSYASYSSAQLLDFERAAAGAAASSFSSAGLGSSSAPWDALSQSGRMTVTPSLPSLGGSAATGGSASAYRLATSSGAMIEGVGYGSASTRASSATRFSSGGSGGSSGGSSGGGGGGSGSPAASPVAGLASAPFAARTFAGVAYSSASGSPFMSLAPYSQQQEGGSAGSSVGGGSGSASPPAPPSYGSHPYAHAPTPQPHQYHAATTAAAVSGPAPTPPRRGVSGIAPSPGNSFREAPSPHAQAPAQGPASRPAPAASYAPSQPQPQQFQQPYYQQGFLHTYQQQQRQQQQGPQQAFGGGHQAQRLQPPWSMRYPTLLPAGGFSGSDRYGMPVPLAMSIMLPAQTQQQQQHYYSQQQPQHQHPSQLLHMPYQPRPMGYGPQAYFPPITAEPQQHGSQFPPPPYVAQAPIQRQGPRSGYPQPQQQYAPAQPPDTLYRGY